MKRRSRGFTLMELMVVVALAAVVMGIGVPSFRDFARSNRLTVAANNVLGGIITARGEALRQQETVSMCPSKKALDDAGTCDGGTDWIIFIDKNGDCVRDSGELRVAGAVVDTDVKVANNSTCISFASTGFKRVVAGVPTTQHMMYCDERGNTAAVKGSLFSNARGIEILPTGRATVIRKVTELSGWNSGGNPVACP